LYKQGVKYGRAALFQQAAELFERTLALDPDYEDAYYSLGHAYFDLGDWDKSIAALRTFLLFHPNDSQALEMLAQAETAKKSSPIVEQPNSQPSKVRARLASVSSPSAAAVTTEQPNPTTIYKIGPGDVLDVRVNRADNSSSVFTISASGVLDHPSLIDPLPVVGLTVEEVTARFEARMKRRGADDQKVSIGVNDYASHTILVSGLVKESGTKVLRREAIPLYVVVADAQPLPEASRLTLVRNHSQEDISLVDTDRMNLLVFPGDVITLLPELEQFFYVTGEVVSPGEKKYRQGLTLTQALIVTGGVTAKAKEARVARDRGDGFLVVTRYKLKDIHSGKLRDPSIGPGDRITIVE
jgi:protein involved in polysaccharide export with SLBB domain